MHHRDGSFAPGGAGIDALEVTHDAAYEAVAQGCAERMTVELYPIQGGWTVFGRFSRFAREEKVDAVQADELSALADSFARDVEGKIDSPRETSLATARYALAIEAASPAMVTSTFPRALSAL